MEKRTTDKPNAAADRGRTGAKLAERVAQKAKGVPLPEPPAMSAADNRPQVERWSRRRRRTVAPGRVKLAFIEDRVDLDRQAQIARLDRPSLELKISKAVNKAAQKLSADQTMTHVAYGYFLVRGPNPAAASYAAAGSTVIYHLTFNPSRGSRPWLAFDPEGRRVGEARARRDQLIEDIRLIR